MIMIMLCPLAGLHVIADSGAKIFVEVTRLVAITVDHRGRCARAAKRPSELSSSGGRSYEAAARKGIIGRVMVKIKTSNRI
jgi:hypothetical protein